MPLTRSALHTETETELVSPASPHCQATAPNSRASSSETKSEAENARKGPSEGVRHPAVVLSLGIHERFTQKTVDERTEDGRLGVGVDMSAEDVSEDGGIGGYKLLNDVGIMTRGDTGRPEEGHDKQVQCRSRIEWVGKDPE